MAWTLSEYLEDARSLTRDGLSIWTSTKQLTRWINATRRNAARRTGCIRLLLCGQSQFGASAQPGFAIPGAMVPGSLPNAVAGSGSTNAFMTIAGVESYPFQWANHYLREQYAGADEITREFLRGDRSGGHSPRVKDVRTDGALEMALRRDHRAGRNVETQIV